MSTLTTQPTRKNSTRLSISRAQFLRFLSGAAVTYALGKSEAVEATKPETNQWNRIARIIREYDAQGNHRTGSVVDDASGRWLADEVRALGLEPILEQMPFSKIDIQSSYLEIEGRRLEGLPLFDSPFTGVDGILGSIGKFDSSAEIGLLRMHPIETARLAEQRRQTKQRALVVVTAADPSSPLEMVKQAPDGLILFNADNYQKPFGPPVLQLPTQYWPQLEKAISSRTQVRVVTKVTRRNVNVFNVSARIRGTNPELPPLVVMTPRSGWWNCASERGGGIAVWLEMIRSLHDARPARTVLFIATTGHEVGDFGLNNYLSLKPSLIKQAYAWIHLGANLGAAIAPQIGLQASDEELQTLALAMMEDVGQKRLLFQPIGTRPLGQARNIYDGGGRYISFLGSNGLYHHPYDRWPIAINLEVLEPITLALVNIGKNLAVSTS